MAEDALKIDDFLCFAIYSANGAFNRAYRPLLDALGLTYPQYVTMVTLWERDGRTVTELGDALFLESNTLTPLLKRLETAGLVRRERDTNDERQVRVRLTDQGRGLKDRAASVPAAISRAAGASTADRGQVLESVARLRNSLDAHSAERRQRTAKPA